MNEQQPQSGGEYDVNNQWQPGLYDADGVWHAGFFDAAGDWQPGFYDTNGQWQAGYLDTNGTWRAGFRSAGQWHDAVAPTPQTTTDAATAAGAAASAEAPPEELAQEEEPEKKRNNTALIVLIIVVVLAALGAGGYYAYERFIASPDTVAAEMDQEPQPSEDAEPAATDAPADQEPEEPAETGPAEVGAGYFDAEAEGIFTDAQDLQEDTAEVDMPLGVFTIEEIGTLEEIDIDGEPSVAAEGEQLQAVSWSFTPGSRDQAPPAGEVNLRNSNGGTHFVADLDYSDSASGEFVASVDDETILVVESHGVEQEISLATGERIPTLPAAGFYRDDWELPGQTISMDSDALDSSHSVSANLTMNESLITTYESSTLEPQGWADSGNIWVASHFDLALTGDQSAHEFMSGTWYFTARDQNGLEYSTSYVSQAGGQWGWPDGNFWIAFEVPVGTEYLEVTPSLSANFSSWTGGGSGDVTIPGETFVLEYPHELSD